MRQIPKARAAIADNRRDEKTAYRDQKQAGKNNQTLIQEKAGKTSMVPRTISALCASTIKFR